jgi:hypothetical protein
MINPWKQTDDKRSAEEISGVLFPEIREDALPSDMKPDTWFAMPGIIEARFHNGEDRLIIRRTNRDTERLSGDYNSYPVSFEHPAGSFILQCRGTEDSVNTAEFRVFGGCASIVMNPGQPGRGLSPEQLETLAALFL